MEAPPAPPKVTALIVSYNAAAALRRSLTALEASQGRERLEIIVIDNGSVDDSPRLDTEFPNVTFMRLPKNFGSTKALNIGMRTATGDFIFFLTPQVVVEPGTVLALLSRIEADENVAAVCPLLVDDEGNPAADARRLPPLDSLSRLWWDPEALPPVAVDLSADEVAVEYPGRRAWLIRKFFVKALNWLDERYGEFGYELELAFQMRRSQRRILLFPSIRATWNDSGTWTFDESARATLAADRAHGVARFAAKHAGWFQGLKLQMGAVFHVLGQLLSFREPGYQFSLLVALLGGTKIDGNQQNL
jgi:GT2 family glycosyltransferase